MRLLAYILSLHVLLASVGWSVYTHTCLKTAVQITSLFRTDCGGHEKTPAGCCSKTAGNGQEGHAGSEDCCSDDLRYYGETLEAAMPGLISSSEDHASGLPVFRMHDFRKFTSQIREVSPKYDAKPVIPGADAPAVLQVFRC